MTPDDTYTAQLKNALQAICDNAIRDTTLGVDCIDAPYLNEARALLESDNTPTTEDQP